MAHNPVNHPARPIYRALGGLVGLYLLVFGVVGLIETGGDNVFGTNADRVLGQGANLGWSIVSIVLGAVILAATVIGRNLDVAVDKFLGWALLVIGSYGLATIRTDVNVFGFTISTIVVSYVLGLALMLSSLYCKVVPEEQAGTPRHVQEGQPA